MTKPSYSELLAAPEWKTKRIEIINKFGARCMQCLTETAPFHVHHRYYISNRKPWHYPDACYRVLCGDCHEWYHDNPIAQAPWEQFLDKVYPAVLAIGAERECAQLFDEIVALILRFRPSVLTPKPALDDEENWMLEYNPHGGHPFHITKPEWVIGKYIENAYKQKDGEWRPIVFGVSHELANEIADNLRIYWKERGMPDATIY